MKNLNLIFATILFAIFTMTSCQKDRLDEMANPTETATTENLDVESILSQAKMEMANAVEITPENMDRNLANSRANSQLFYESTRTIPSSGLGLFYFYKQNLPNPATHKIEIKITPINGNQSLYISGRNIQTGNWRLIRQSVNQGMTEEFVSFRKSGLKTNEDRLYISITGQAQTSYRIQLYIAEVDCEEYAPVEAIINYDWAPTCSCDGTQQFGNSSSAWAAGYTSWTNGACTLEDGQYRNVELNNPNADLTINRIIISGSSSYIRFRSTACLAPNRDACLWDRVPLTYDIFTGKWVAHAERSNNRKSMEIDIKIVKNGDLLEADIQYSDIIRNPNGTMGGSLNTVQETFEKI